MRLKPHSRALQINVFPASEMLPQLLPGLQIAERDVVLVLGIVRVPAKRRLGVLRASPVRRGLFQVASHFVLTRAARLPCPPPGP